MRGGTSKGLIIDEKFLPDDPIKRDKVILNIYGSPHPKQIDGIGGGTAVTSKVALVRKSDRKDFDLYYTFGQVSITKEKVDYKPTCGNMSAAVGLYAVEEGWCELSEPVTVVKIFNTNTNKIIEVEVPVKNGQIIYEGNYSISGVNGTASRINVNFIDPGGAITGNLLPTGNVKDLVELSNGDQVEASVIDAANTIIFVKAEQMGIQGTETGEQFNRSELLDKLEEIRTKIGFQIGLLNKQEKVNPVTHALPKIAVVSAPKDYYTNDGKFISKNDIHIVGRYIAMGTLHPAFAVSGSIALATGCKIPGTVINEVLSDHQGSIVIGHPSGTIEVDAIVEKKDEKYKVKRAAIGRTARRIMEGNCLVPAKLFN